MIVKGLIFVCFWGSILSYGCPTVPPKRVIALTPALTELVLELKTPSTQIVGVPEFSPPVKGAESVGPFHKLSTEKIHTLKPDVLFASDDGNIESDIIKLKKLGYSIQLTHSGQMAEIKNAFTKVACELANPDSGRRWNDRFDQVMLRIRKKYAPLPKLKAVYELGFSPFVGIGSHTYLTELLGAFGLVNLLGEYKKYPRVSKEWIFSLKPDLILIFAMNREDQDSQDGLNFWSQKNKFRSFRLINEALLRPGPRLIEGLEFLEKELDKIRTSL
jgi:iron complex transport system substrate-binding protein